MPDEMEDWRYIYNSGGRAGRGERGFAARW